MNCLSWQSHWNLAIDNLLEELRRWNNFRETAEMCFHVVFLNHKNNSTSMPYTIFLGIILTSALLLINKMPYSLLKPQKTHAHREV